MTKKALRAVRAKQLAPNQTVIYVDGSRIFQSYSSTIAIVTGNKVTLGRDWDYSRTTGKYRNQFLGEGIAETRLKLATGEYKYDEEL